MWDQASSTIKNWLDSGASNNVRLWSGFGLIVLGLGLIDFAYAVLGLGVGLIVWQLAIEDPDASVDASDPKDSA